MRSGLGIVVTNAVSVDNATNGLAIASSNLYAFKGQGLASNTISVVGPIGGARTYTGNVGLTNAFWGLTNYDVMDIGPGTYTFKSLKNVAGVTYGGLQVGSDAGGTIHDLTIRGHSATLISTNYGSMLAFDGCSNVFISGLTFVGEMTTVTNWTNADWTIECAILTTTNTATVRVSGITIEDCKFYSLPDQAISFLHGGAWDSHVRYCGFYGIGRTNNIGGGALSDGACVSGVLFSGAVHNNVGTNVQYFYEWDGIQSGKGHQGKGLIIANNVIEGLHTYGAIFNPGAGGQSLSGLTIADNVFLFDGNDWENNQTHAGIAFWGSISNAVIRGNTIKGLTNYVYSRQIWIQDTVGPHHNLRFEGNSLRDSLATGIFFDNTVGNYDHSGLVVDGNFFQNVYLPMRLSCGNVNITRNEFSDWPSGTDYGGNQLATLYLTGTGVSNIVYSGNVLAASNAACRAISKLGDYSIRYTENVNRKATMTAPLYSSVTSSNLFWRDELWTDVARALYPATQGTNFIVDFAFPSQTITATNNVRLLQSTNRAAGRETTLILDPYSRAAGSEPKLYYTAASWKTNRSAVIYPDVTNILVLHLFCWGPDETNVLLTTGEYRR